MIYATLGALTFRADGETATYTIAKFDGWWGGAEFRHDQTSRPTADGDFDAPVYRGGRILTIEGLVLASSVADLEDALAALEDLLGDGSMDTLTVVQESATYTLEVRRHGGLSL